MKRVVHTKLGIYVHIIYVFLLRSYYHSLHETCRTH